MIFEKLELEDVILISPNKITDNRGYFSEIGFAAPGAWTNLAKIERLHLMIREIIRLTELHIIFIQQIGSIIWKFVLK